MSRTQKERQTLRNSHKDAWVPVKSGDSIMGKVVDVVDAWSSQRRDPATNRPGSSYPLLTIEAEEATGYDNLPRELKVHCFGAVLFNEIMRKQPGIGERIRIAYQGVGEAKEGQSAPELYSVRAAAGADTAARAYGAIPVAPVARRPGGAPSVDPAPQEAPQQTMDDDDIPF